MSEGKKFNIESQKISVQLNQPCLVAFEYNFLSTFQILHNTLFLLLKKKKISQLPGIFLFD